MFKSQTEIFGDVFEDKKHNLALDVKTTEITCDNEPIKMNNLFGDEADLTGRYVEHPKRKPIPQEWYDDYKQRQLLLKILVALFVIVVIGSTYFLGYRNGMNDTRKMYDEISEGNK